MHFRKTFLVFLLLLRVAFAFACDLEGHFRFYVSNSGGDILYSGCYDAINSGPHITDYVLTKERAEDEGVDRPSVSFSQTRDGGILKDLLEENGYSLPLHRYFTNSGFDRGHMAPNSDFNDTTENATLTFFIGNIWPQEPHLNRTVWLGMENETRDLASQYSTVRVIITVDEFSDRKVETISVPASFRRQVYDYSTGELIYDKEVKQSFRANQRFAVLRRRGCRTRTLVRALRYTLFRNPCKPLLSRY